MTDDVIESDDDNNDVIDDIITIPVEEMSVKNEVFNLNMDHNEFGQNQMTHNSMNHNQMIHNQVLQSSRKNVPLYSNNDSKRKFNRIEFDWSMQMTNQKKQKSSALEFKRIKTPESRLSSSSFSSGLPSSTDYEEPSSPPASLNGFTTHVINQENYHRNELILVYGLI